MAWYLYDEYGNRKEFCGPYRSKRQALDHLKSMSREYSMKLTLGYEEEDESKVNYGASGDVIAGKICSAVFVLGILGAGINYVGSASSKFMPIIENYAIPAVIGFVVLIIFSKLFKPLMRLILKLIKWGFYVAIIAGGIYWLDSMSQSSEGTKKEIVSESTTSESEIQEDTKSIEGTNVKTEDSNDSQNISTN